MTKFHFQLSTIFCFLFSLSCVSTLFAKPFSLSVEAVDYADSIAQQDIKLLQNQDIGKYLEQSINKKSELINSHAIDTPDFRLFIEVHSFQINNHVEFAPTSQMYRKNHDFDFVMLFRVLNQNNEILFEKELHGNADFNSYLSSSDDINEKSAEVQRWLQQRLQMNLDLVAQGILKQIPPLVIGEVQAESLIVRLPSNSALPESGRYVVFKPVQMVMDPKQAQMIRSPGETLGEAQLLSQSKGVARFTLQAETKTSVQPGMLILPQ